MCAAQVRKDELPKQIITVKLRLRDKHCADLNRQARAVNLVWNYCNETSEKAWRRDRKLLSKYDLVNLVSGCSKILSIHSHSAARVCINFASRRNLAKRCKLRWRNERSLGWIPFNTGHIKFDGKYFIFNKMKYEPMHLRDFLIAGMKFPVGSFNQDAKGHWYINLSIEVKCAEKSIAPSVGIDLGLKDLACLSDGRKVDMPSFYRKSESSLGMAQRARKARRVKAIHAKIANRRKDFLHKESLKIAQNCGLIFVGDVSPKKIAQTKMAKSARDAGWYSFKIMISYKALMHGGKMIEVNERCTTQTCSSCGSLPQSRPKGIAGLGIREWTCDDCGAVHDRDVNAARNILRIGLDTLAEGVAI